MAKKNTILSKIYREFTRVKFQKYRLQFPRVRQSELIAKIIKEWEAMDEEAKLNLENQYTERSGKGFLEDPSSSSRRAAAAAKQKELGPMSSSARESGTKKVTKKKKPSPKVRVFIEKSKTSPEMKITSKEELASFKKDSKENSKSPGKKSTPSKNQTSSSELAIQKAKGDGKVPEVKKTNPKVEQYHNFYKYYHDRLTVEHPRWSTPQITTIIKLLWRKRHVKDKKKRAPISGKAISGRQLYNRTKLSEGLIRQQIKQLWKALPHESKKYWEIKGKGKPNRSDKDSGRFVRRVLNSGANKDSGARENEPVFGWMNQQMK